MRLTVFGCVLLVLFAGFGPRAVAQDDPPAPADWRVVVAHAEELYTITPDGITPTLANITDPTIQLFDRTTAVLNGDWVAMESFDKTQIMIGNLAELDNCCTYLPFPDDYYYGEIPPGQELLEFELAAISADGNLIFMRDVYAETDALSYTTHAHLILYRVVASGASDDGIFGVASYDAPAGNWTIEMGPWVEGGLHFRVNCHHCTHGPLIREHVVWYLFPEGGGAWENLPISFETGDYLYATGELLQMTVNSEFARNEADGPVPMPNVLAYDRYDQEGNSTDYAVLLHDPENLQRYAPIWVMDGAAYLYRVGNDLWFADRTGAVQLVRRDDPVQTTFLVATPDGWLMFVYGTGEILHYTAPTDFSAIGTFSTDQPPAIISTTPLAVGTPPSTPLPITLP